MLETNAAPPPVAGRMTVAEVGDRRIKQLARSGRKPDTTLANYESEIRIHFAPHFGETTVDEINADDVEDFIDACLDAEDRIDRGLAELSVKTVRNLYVHLNGIFEFAISKGWAHANPCRAVDKPASPEDDETEIRFLDQAELDALLAAATTPVCRHTPATLARAAQARTLRDVECLEWQQVGERLGCSAATAIYLYRATPEAVLDNDLARVDRALYLTAAMTGLRQGELLGLRGGTWTGPRKRCASCGPTSEASSGRPSRGSRRERSRWPIASAKSWSCCSRPPLTRPKTISCLGTHTPATHSNAAR